MAEMPFGPPKPDRMRVGINYPWCNYGWDFGNPPWGKRHQWEKRICQDLKLFNYLGIFAVRWWILGSGLLYGTGSDAPVSSSSGAGRQLPRSSGPGGGLQVKVPNISTDIVDDFKLLLACFSQAKMKIVPVFVDYYMFLDPDPGELKNLPKGYIKGGRHELITNPSARAHFLEKALRPLLEATKGFEHVIYAWDLINEPENCTRENVQQGRVDRKSMLDFLREGVRRINNSKLPSTVGFAEHATIKRWSSSDLKIGIHQFHYYAKESTIPRNWIGSNLFVGEFASAVHKKWPDLHDDDVRDPNKTVFERLTLLQKKNYPAAFVWSAEEHPADPPDKEPQPVAWNDATRKQIRRFTTSSL